MRVLALDYGAGRCGVAVSDPSGTIATPLEPVLRPATKRGFAELLNRIAELEPERVIVGLPLSLSGGDSAQTTETRAFADKLARAIKVPVELYDERFTTSLALQAGGSGSLDSRAAATLLAEWLELPNKGGSDP
ncbi:MAG TPA: Holliday junction resolvase RuvX [Solirubrobacter sp.]|nr:Holliday junction resolvase RuvX [Solirubrobacter sp.]